MKHMRQWMTTALACALLAACGGGDPAVPGTGAPSGAPTTEGHFTALVSFGDSLSDVGTYAPATQLPGTNPPVYFGGKFTTNNGAAGTIWVENVAAALGLVVTPAEVGFAGQSVACPAAAVPALAATCTAYGQGGSRVTDPNGIGHVTAAGDPAALTVPLKTQIENHIARFGGFKDTDLVVVFGGNNDVFYQFGVFAAAAAQIAANTSLSADQAQQQLFAAQTAAQGEMKKAAQELAGYVKDRILANGGKYVAVFNLPDSALTPFGAALKADPASAPLVPVLSTLVDTFNLWLNDSLAGAPVQIVDAHGQFRDAYLNPSKYGLVNNTTPACDAAKIAALTGNAVTDGSSLFCNATPGAPYNTLVDGADVDTWEFADSVHPTTGGHKVFSDVALKQLQSYGWIPAP